MASDCLIHRILSKMKYIGKYTIRGLLGRGGMGKSLKSNIR